jgi:hypothetical protein
MSRPLLTAWLAAGLLVRLAVLPLRGSSDVNYWKTWTANAARDLGGVYGVGPSAPVPNVLEWAQQQKTITYPPLAVEELAVTGKIYGAWNPQFTDGRSFDAAVKVPGVLAELAFTAILLSAGTRRFGSTVARRAALAFWLNPAVIIHGPLLGYLDAQVAVPATLSALTAFGGSGWMAGMWLGVALATKPQAILVAPVIVGVMARRGGARGRSLAWMIVGAALAAGVTMLPFIWRGATRNVMLAVATAATHDALSAYAANVWWIVTWIGRASMDAATVGWPAALFQKVQMASISHIVARGWPSPRVIGTVVVAACTAWAGWRASRATGLADALAWAGWSVFAYFLFAAQVHENHVYLALPFFALAAALDERFRMPFWALSAADGLNVALFYGLGGDIPFPARVWRGFDLSVLLAFANLGLFVWITSRASRCAPCSAR